MTKSQVVLDILQETFKNNKSTNFVIKQGRKRDKRLKMLIEYSIFYGENFGQVILSEDKQSCAIILENSKKKTTLESVFWDLKLTFYCIGIFRVYSVLKRNKMIGKVHPKNNFLNLWYIGVKEEHQGNGKGTKLLKEIINEAKKQNKAIYLETSTERNFPFYERLGFKEVSAINQSGYLLKVYAL